MISSWCQIIYKVVFFANELVVLYKMQCCQNSEEIKSQLLVNFPSLTICAILGRMADTLKRRKKYLVPVIQAKDCFCTYAHTSLHTHPRVQKTHKQSAHTISSFAHMQNILLKKQVHFLERLILSVPEQGVHTPRPGWPWAYIARVNTGVQIKHRADQPMEELNGKVLETIHSFFVVLQISSDSRT